MTVGIIINIILGIIAMKKIFIIFSMVLLIFPLFMGDVMAHPGRTDSNGGHTCRTNCAKWGLQTGEYHYHNGAGSSTKNTESPPKTKPSTPAPPPKPTYSQADIDEGRALGKSQGYEDGYSRGTSNTVNDTGNEGFKKGYAAGYEAGYAEGLKKIKEEDRVFGTDSGGGDGKVALREGQSREVPKNEAQSDDWNAAYQAAFIKSFDHEKVVQNAEQSGHDLGYSLVELVVPNEYANDKIVKETYEAHYKTGYEERIKEENDKHLELGNEAGYALTPSEIDSLDVKFAESYELGYEEGKSKREEEVLAEGYQSAFLNMKYKEIDDYDHQELIDWYKEGFKSNEIAVQIKETAFENGYTNSDYFIPEEFKINDESIALYDSLFEEGQALRAQEKQKKMMYITGISIPAGGISIGGYFLRKRKKKQLA